MSMIGKTLAHYEITSQLGKGGMGEVYRAKDRKLGRDVAIKVLPEEFARDADRVARFQREAKLLASLNHPSIAAIYGLETSEQTNFLVLELVEGETLADRIKTGLIPAEESLKLALQIAEALEAAHEKGVIHRDLKPANIKVTPEGKVKVLDFGLAKAFAGEQAELNLSNSPTLSDMATQQGIILGTAAYMSPEQARGKSVDKRADIWAFGCVLYEMLTGQAVFQGEDVTEILAAVVKDGVNLDLLPANLHFRVREAITRCLQKDLRRRYPGITDVRYEIEQALADPNGGLVHSQTAAEQPSTWKLVLPWASIAAVFSLIIGGLAVWQYKPTEPRQVVRFEYNLPESQQLANLSMAVIAISPDGKQFIYSTTKGIYLRSVDELAAKIIPGTEENTAEPLFSPDGKWIGYYSITDKKWKKIPVSGGAPVVLCDANAPLNASWGADDTIVYSENGKGIMRISANGGTPELIVKQIGVFLTDPQILPDEKTVLFGIVRESLAFQIAVQAMKSGEPKILFEGANARYLPTGHLVYGLRNSLFAIPFNLDRLEVSGSSVPLVEGVFRLGAIYTTQYSVSNSGTLVYIHGFSSADASTKRTLVWLDRKAKETPIPAPPNNYSCPNISPDGTKVALTISSSPTKSDIWIWDFARETMTRLTFNEKSAYPLWTPDGKRIAFSSDNPEGTGTGISWKAADGTGAEERLCSAQNLMGLVPSSWSRDGKTLIVDEVTKENMYFIDALPLEGDRKLKTLLKEKYQEVDPEVSPDGRWLAYGSLETGREEIYVRPFPDVNNGKWQISTGGGGAPKWSPDGRELFYGTGADSAMVVAVQTQPTFKPGKAEPLFRGVGPYVTPYWDISHDGKRFLSIKEPQPEPSAGSSPRKINVVLNWLEELKQRVPVK
jgi:serine/threonine protein kinase